MAAKRKVYVALGGNIGDTKAIFDAAVEKVNTLIGPVAKVSNYYRSSPMNPPGLESQPDFLNAVLLCLSVKEAEEILKILIEIERSLGRNRKQEIKWGPRPIDLDLLAVEQQVINTKDLILPHPEMHKRDFVLIPLAEIEPNFMHPSLNIEIHKLISALTSFHLNQSTVSEHCPRLSETASNLRNGI